MQSQKRLFLARRIRLMTQMLLLSICLNLIVFGLFFYFTLRQNGKRIAFDYPPSPPSVKEEKNFSNEELLLTYLSKSYATLLPELKNTTLQEHGYRARDLALAVLLSKHHLDVTRALGRNLSDRRLIKCNHSPIVLIPGLDNEDYTKILQWCKKEQCPFTTKGIHGLLVQKRAQSDPTLVATFLQSQEFRIVETLFINTTTTPLKRKVLFSLTLDLPFECLEDFLQKQKNGLSLTEETRREFLLNALSHHSKIAAALLLILEGEIVQKRFSDETIAKLLDLLPENSHKAREFARQMLASPRSSLVHEKARKLLKIGEVAQIRPERPSLGELRPLFREKAPASLAKQHKIQAGDSLYSLSQKHEVSIDALMHANNLRSSTLQVGKILKIP